MLEKIIQYFVGSLALVFLLCFERVIGIPMLSVIFFYTFFLSQATNAKLLVLTLFSLVTAALFMTSPVVVSSLLVVGYAFFLFTTGKSGSMSVRVVYMSLLVAIGISSAAHLVWTVQVGIFLLLQVVVAVVITRRYIFKETTKSLQWQQGIYTNEVHEKKI
jgi:hypothetical protein